jgi:hypothetical protein
METKNGGVLKSSLFRTYSSPNGLLTFYMLMHIHDILYLLIGGTIEASTLILDVNRT